MMQKSVSTISLGPHASSVPYPGAPASSRLHTRLSAFSQSSSHPPFTLETAEPVSGGFLSTVAAQLSQLLESLYLLGTALAAALRSLTAGAAAAVLDLSSLFSRRCGSRCRHHRS